MAFASIRESVAAKADAVLRKNLISIIVPFENPENLPHREERARAHRVELREDFYEKVMKVGYGVFTPVSGDGG